MWVLRMRYTLQLTGQWSTGSHRSPAEKPPQRLPGIGAYADSWLASVLHKSAITIRSPMSPPYTYCANESQAKRFQYCPIKSITAQQQVPVLTYGSHAQKCSYSPRSRY
ncbi:hypothetical protein NDU88_007433 [Pleurodeles waltl]|uniref:Uncharacterized protein n=1 Tax=Pleurodeles waltl TaxID=8319 RepID=A0AAV7PP86_PLEWA|nr:hypothetical protein NDU88_007433 [Pleurodeles waltl]